MRRTIRRPSLVLIPLAVLLAACGGGGGGGSYSSFVGKPAPEITGQDTEGKTLKLSDYKGKVVVLDFWGDW